MPNLKGRDTQLLFGFQSDFVTHATGWQPLTTYSHTLGATKAFVDDPQLGRGGFHNGRDPVSSAPALPVGEGSIEVPLCLNELGYWLKLLFGAPTTSGAGADKTHVFNSGAASLPFASIMRKFAADDYRHLRGVMANTLSLTAEKTDGYPRVSLGCFLRDEARATSALAGTVASAMAQLRPAAARGAARWDTVLMGNVTSVNLNFSNQLERINDLNGSEAPGTIDPGDVALSGDFTVRYSGQSWETIAANETAGRLELEWTHPSAPTTRLFNIDLKRTLIIPQGTPITGPGGVSVTYQIRPEQQSGQPALIATLKNAITAYA